MRVRLLGIGLLVFCFAEVSYCQSNAGVRVAAEAKAVYELDEKAKAAFEKLHPKTLPESKRKLPKATAKSFDWSKYGVTGPIYTQGRSPYCWAFAALEAFECSWRIRNKSNLILSVQPILDHTKVKGGAPFSLAMKDLFLNGTAPLSKYPTTGKPGKLLKVDTKYRAVAFGYIGRGREVPSTEVLKEALLKHGPLVVGIYSSPKAFKNYKGGVYAGFDKPPAGDQPVNHAVLLVGWDDKVSAWKIKNSWNTTWGEGGYMRIKYGSNNVGVGAMWIRAQSTYYHLPEDAHTLVNGDAKPFHRWPSGKTVKAGKAD